MSNGNTVVPTTVSATTMAIGDKVMPTTTATPYGGGVVPGRNNPSGAQGLSTTTPTTLFGAITRLLGIG